MRRIAILIVITCVVIFWGQRTLTKLRNADAEARQANAERLLLVRQMQGFERHLVGLNRHVDMTLSRPKGPSQTSRIAKLQDHRNGLADALEPLRPRLLREPVRLEGMEAQIEELGSEVGKLIKSYNRDGVEATQELRRNKWAHRYQSIYKSIQTLFDRLLKEVETDWQSSRLAQDSALKELIFGTAAITCFALIWVGLLLVNSYNRGTLLRKRIKTLGKRIGLTAGDVAPADQIEALIESCRTAPIGPSFLTNTLQGLSVPAAILDQGRVTTTTPAFKKIFGEFPVGVPFVELMVTQGPMISSTTNALARSTGEWTMLEGEHGEPAAISLRAANLNANNLSLVELLDERRAYALASTDAVVKEFASNLIFYAIIEPMGKVVVASDSVCTYLGVSQTDLQLAHLTNFNLGVDGETAQSILDEVESSGMWAGELTIRRPRFERNGQVSLRVTPHRIDQDDRDLLLIVGTSVDAVQASRDDLASAEEKMAELENEGDKLRKRLMDDRRKLTMEATGALQSFSNMQDLVEAFAREVRDPLNGLVGISELLGEAQPTPRIEQLRSTADLLTGLVHDLLDHAHLEAGNLELNTEAVDVQAVCKLVTGRYARYLRGDSLHLALDVTDHPQRLALGDSTRITQIIDTLVARAIKYARPGATVRVLVDLGQDDRVVMRVSDGGGPLPAGAEDDLFRLVSLGGFPGAQRWTGLELGMLRLLSKTMGSELSAETLDHEMVWTLSMPVASTGLPQASVSGSPKPSAASSNDPEVPPAAVPASVLVADDDEVNRLVANGLLTRLGCRVEVVNDGQEALDKLQHYTVSGKSPYDLVLVDLLMPNLGGLGFTEAIRKAESGLGISAPHHLPIVAVTGKAGEASEATCRAIGMDAFIAKPYSHQQLEEIISRFADH